MRVARRFCRLKLPLGDEKGGVLVFVSVGMLSVLLIAGLALDAGRGYVVKAELSRAVDAAALAAARSMREGETAARKKAVSLAGANAVQSGQNGTSLSVSFGTNEFDEPTVTVVATRDTPTLLMRLIERDNMDVRSAAVAAVPPVDLVLVLDQSGSLGMAWAWDDLQDAAKEFVRHFDDELDQMGLVSFNVRAAHHFPIGNPFVANAVSAIEGMTSVSYTNTGEGLRLAHEQFQGGAARDRSAKVVVFFTDGRPTAFRGDVAGSDRVVAAWNGGRSAQPAGYWDNPDEIIMDPVVDPDRTRCNASNDLCWGHTKGTVWDQAEADGLFWADQIRQEGILVYTIGLGDSSQPPGSELQPRPDYLRLLANEDGMTNSDQPKGKMYFAPSAGEIRTVFNLVASDLLARLTY